MIYTISQFHTWVVKSEPVDHSDEENKMEASYEDIDYTGGGMEEEEMEIVERPEKEVINCVCGYMEEEGFMLQVGGGIEVTWDWIGIGNGISVGIWKLD